MSGDALFVLGVCLVAFVAWLLNWIPDDPAPADRDQQKAREDAVRRKQSAARVRMKREGIKSLLDGRPAWQRINPMGREAKAPTVITLRRKS